ncbi:MAG: exodeoxyribonuclease VII small subunit [bacterium]
MTQRPGESTAPELSFEAAQQRLREIVQRMEDPSLPLEESLALFEEGSRLAKHCQALLDRAEARIEVLLGQGTGRSGELRTEPLGELDGREGSS